MSFTLRTEPQDEEALARLAQRFGVSKHEATLMAIRATDERTNRDAEVRALTQRALTDWSAVLERLKHT